jgi:hypothetical protein
MLSTNEINHLLKNKKDFLGVFPVDRLPYLLVPKPTGLIINLDESYKPGSHWVAVYIPKNGPAHYFDPFGAVPGRHVSLFLDRNSKHGWVFNAAKFQGDLSYLCGYYCVLFIKYAPNYKAFYEKFKTCNYFENDINVIKLLKIK